MKWLIGLLLLINAAVFGYFKLLDTHPSESRVGHEPISPEKLRIVTRAELDALPKKSPEPAPIPATPTVPPPQLFCYEWGNFSVTDVLRARAILDKFSLDFGVKQKTTKDATRYWIYIPPRKSLEEAQAKVSELNSLGIVESFIVDEARWRYAISLGIYKDENLANRFLDDLRKHGVRSAVKGVRNHENGQSSFFIRNMSTDTARELGKLRPDFSGSELKQVGCQ